MSQVRRLGGQVGCEAARVYLGLQLLPFDTAMSGSGNRGRPLASGYEEPLPEPDTVVRVMSREVMLPLIEQPPLSDAQARVDEAQRRLDDLKERPRRRLRWRRRRLPRSAPT